MRELRVLLVDDEPLAIDLLSAFLRRIDGVDVVGQCRNGEDAVKKARPPASKGTYIRKITVTSSMGPGVKVDPVQAQELEVSL